MLSKFEIKIKKFFDRQKINKILDKIKKYYIILTNKNS